MTDHDRPLSANAGEKCVRVGRKLVQTKLIGLWLA
jgi:hypothetical protein